MALTKRSKILREKMLTLPAVDVERAVFMTESYKETAGQPQVLRQAKAIANVLHNITTTIDDGELIVGWHTSKQVGAALVPEMDASWIECELDTLNDRDCEKYLALTEDEKKKITEIIIPYWRGKSAREKWAGLVPPEIAKLENIIQNGGNCRNTHHHGHTASNFERILEWGLEKTIEDLEERKAGVDITKPGELHKYYFYEAGVVLQKAVLDFASRYADLAEAKAGDEEDPVRKAELLEIARVCRYVPAKPATTFREAVQSAWFLFVCVMIEGWGAGQSIGRFDQYLYPYYKRDLEAGKITREEAVELMQLVLIRMNSVVICMSGFLQVAFAGYPVQQGICLGGETPQGRDAVNDLSYIILDAEEDVALTHDEMVIRISAKNPDSFVIRACEVAKTTHGKLKFVSDETTIAALLELGFPLEYARQYISTGCHNPGIPGYAHMMSGVIYNCPLMLELALNDGKRRLTGDQIGPRSGDPRQFENLEQVEEAMYSQFEELMQKAFVFKHVDMEVECEFPVTLCSSFIMPCIEKGTDLYALGRPYSTHTTSLMGIADIADSLAALKKVVFDDKRYTMAEVIDALDNNFEGAEEMRYHLMKAPKFGNDDDYVDVIAARTTAWICDFLRKHETINGRPTTPGTMGMTINLSYGELMGATPDGRLAGEPLAEGGISPHQGRNTSGAVATMRSVCKVDQIKMTNGSIFNIRMSPSSLKDQASVLKFARMIRTFCEHGGDMVQFNITDTKTLRDAQEHPEKYRDLMVRVATYSSFFVELSRPQQDDIIARTECGF